MALSYNNQVLKSLYISYDGIFEQLGQSQVLPYLRELAKRNFNFILVTFEKKKYEDHIQEINCRSELTQHKIKWVSLRYHKKPPILSTLFDILSGFFVCLVITIREKPSLVHSRSYVTTSIALALKKLFKLKFIFDMRGFWADERVEGRLWKKKGRLYHLVKSLEKHFLTNADEIIVLTNQAKRIIKSWGYNINNVSVIPCCVDTKKFNFNGKSRMELRKKYELEDKFMLIHTGSLEYWYMIEEMLNYFKAAQEIEPRLHFLILTHSDKNIILNLIYEKRLNLNNFTILSAHYDDMPKYLTMADAGLIFITPVFSKKASSPTKFAEYLSCGLPVIFNRGIGDMEEHAEKKKIGVLVSHFNITEYRQTFKELLNLLKESDLKSRCRQAAVENFALEYGVNKYYQIYSGTK